MNTGNGTRAERDGAVEANVKPLLAIVHVTETTDAALRAMNEAGTDFAAVVDDVGARPGRWYGTRLPGHGTPAERMSRHQRFEARRTASPGRRRAGSGRRKGRRRAGCPSTTWRCRSCERRG